MAREGAFNDIGVMYVESDSRINGDRNDFAHSFGRNIYGNVKP